MKISVFTFLLLSYTLTQAQISGSNAWAKGSFIEMGVNDHGIYTAKGLPPAGFVGADTATELFTRSFIVDKDMDGWYTGVPGFWGDYTSAGNSQEGFGLQLNGLNYYNIAEYFAPDNMEGLITKYEDAGDSIIISWDGEVPGVSYSVSQKTVLYKNSLYAITRIILVNISFDYFYNTFYFRNIDPDQEYQFNGNSNTANSVVSNFPADAEALAQAEGAVAGNNFCLIGSRDTRAKVSYGSFDMAAPPSPADIWNGLSPFMQSGTATGDDALQIAVKFDTILPCSAETFSFAYIFTDDAAVIEEALALTERPVYGSLCVAIDTFNISDISTGNFTVSWDADDNMDFVLKYMDMETGVVTEIPTELSTISIAGLESCREYGVNLYSICGGDTLPADPEYTVVKTTCIDDTTSIVSAAAEASFLIYPNPASGHFNIILPGNAEHKTDLCIRDVAGKTVLRQTISVTNNKTEIIDLRDLAGGIYTVELTDGFERNIQKLVVE